MSYGNVDRSVNNHAQDNLLQKATDQNYAPINVKPLGRPGIGGGFNSSHRPIVGSFDSFNCLSSNILLTFSCYFDNPQMPWGGAFEQKLSAQFKCPTYAPPLPSSLTLIGASGLRFWNATSIILIYVFYIKMFNC